ncbi:hypothetical protein OCU04_012140 [Sclerotinia nivalis]|uniref:Uncharacterized protein n=1 Tax=Sclerotinia nivalis TaxID=352851 RepID=A0A9X0AAE8_9HELO|nr:hypothetical protein OCU04_012140 [Sclerotinia nivalis]
MRVSNWIDLTCYVFDPLYPWGQGSYAGEPTAPQGQSHSLRAQYAYWIDQHLAALEAQQATWAAQATRDYQKIFPPTAEQTEDKQAKDRAWIT